MSNLTPDELFDEYAASLTPLLPPNVSLWGLNLVSQYHDALSLELQEVLSVDHTYITPNLASLTDRAKQLSMLFVNSGGLPFVITTLRKPKRNWSLAPL